MIVLYQKIKDTEIPSFILHNKEIVTQVTFSCNCTTPVIKNNIIKFSVNIGKVKDILPPNVYLNQKYYNKNITVTVWTNDGKVQEFPINLHVYEDQ